MADEKIKIIVEGEDQASSVFSKIGGAVQTLGTFALGAAVGGIAALAGGLAFSVGEAMEAEQVTAQLNAVIRSTGGAAGLTAEQVSDMAGELANVTTFTDDAIVSAQSLLLTFTNIGSEVFPDATQAILDLSTATGQDLSSSAIQLGKALNDPVAGITALTRVGVSFTQEQKDVIAALVETGDVAGAQKLILEELNKEFGGSAAAAAATFGGRLAVLKNRLADVAETIGGPILDALSPFLDMLLQLAGDVGDRVTIFLEKLRTPLSFIGEAFRELADGDVAGFFDRMRVAVFGLFQVFGAGQETLATIRTIFNEIKRSIEANLTPFETLMEILDNFLPEETIMAVWGFVEAITNLKNQFVEFITPIIEAVSQFVSWQDVLIAIGLIIAGTVIPAIGGILAAIAPLILVFAGLALAVAAIRQAWETDWAGIRTAAEGAITWITGTGVPNFMAGLNSIVTTTQESFVPNIRAALDAFGPMWDTVMSVIIGPAVDWIVEKLNLGWNLIKAATEIMLTVLTNMWEFFGDNLMTTIGILWDTIKGVFESALTAIKLVVSAAIALIQGDWETFNQNILLAIYNMFDALISFVTGITATVVALFVTLATGILEAFTGTDWGVLGDVIIQGMLAALEAGKGQVIAFITQLANDVIAGIMEALGASSPSQKAYDAFHTIIQGGVLALRDGHDLLKDAGWMAGEAAAHALSDSLNQHMPHLDDLTVGGVNTGTQGLGLNGHGTNNHPGNTLGGPGGTVNNFNMTVHTSASTSTVTQDFHLMQSLAGNH